MRIFVAGGSGVLGRNVIPLLNAAGHEVTATTRSAAKAPLLTGLGATPVVADALDAAGLSAALAAARPEIVLHLLTDLGSGDSASNARLRIDGTRNLVEAARQVGVERMIAESISWVFPSGLAVATEGDALDLDAAEPRRTTVAAVAALESEVLGLAQGSVLRFGLLYGPDTWYSRDGRFGEMARSGELPATETVASFIHVVDAASAVMQAVDWPSGVWHAVDDESAAGHDWVSAFAAAVGGVDPAQAEAGDIGRPVSNQRARARGLTLQYPTWRDGFPTL